MLIHRSILIVLFLAVAMVNSLRFQNEQLQSQYASMWELFDNDNFEQEFVDTQSDHDTMPLEKSEETTISEDDMSVTEVAAQAKKQAEEEEKKEADKEESSETKEATEEKPKEEKKPVETTVTKNETTSQPAQSLVQSDKRKYVSADAFDDMHPVKTHAENPKKVSKELQDAEKLQKSIEKINNNIKESKKALEKHEVHVKELKELVRQQKLGSAARTELDNVLNNAETHVVDLEDHIKKGEKLVDDKESKLELIQKNVNATNQADVEQGKQIKNQKKMKKEEKKEAKKKDEASVLKSSSDDKQPKGKTLAIQDVSIKQIKHKAEKAEELIEKNTDKAHDAHSRAQKIEAEVQKAKLQVKKLEALTAQTKEGSLREQKMKNITEKAKERLAEVEKRVNKQLSKELKANSDKTKAQINYEQAHYDYQAKKADMKEEKINKMAALGEVHSHPGSWKKTKLQKEGEDAINHMKYVDYKSDEVHGFDSNKYRTPKDPREWVNPEKKHESEYDIVEDDDPRLYNNKPHSRKKKHYDYRKERKIQKVQKIKDKKELIQGILDKKPTEKTLKEVLKMSQEFNKVQKHIVKTKPSHHKKKRSHRAKHHKKSHHKKSHGHHDHHHASDHLTQTESSMTIEKNHHQKKEVTPSSDAPLTEKQLMNNPEIQKILNNNNEFWQHTIDATARKFMKKIKNIEKLYQKDANEAEKEHKTFLKKMKKIDK